MAPYDTRLGQPGRQSRQDVLRAYCPNIYTVPFSINSRMA